MISLLTDHQLERYSRQIILDEVGEDGQIKLLNSKILVIGAGGLGSPVLMYLTAAGIGAIGIIDDDTVDVSNLQRQIIHHHSRLGQNKAYSAAQSLNQLNPENLLRIYPQRLDKQNIVSILSDYDLIIDGSDNFPTRYLVHDCCFLLKKPLMSAALLRFEGQISTFKGYLGAPHPCYRCVFPEPPQAGSVPRCQTAGILGSVAGTMGTFLVTETLKEILGIGHGLSGQMLLYDALDQTLNRIAITKQLNCPFCSKPRSLSDLVQHDEVIDSCQIR